MVSRLLLSTIALGGLVGLGAFIAARGGQDPPHAGDSAPGFARVKALIDAKDRSNPTPSLTLAKHPPERADRVSHSEEEWERLLGPHRFRVMRHRGTETPFSSPLVDEHRQGLFVCAGCGNPLFSSAAKFDSGTGWPSFVAPANDLSVWYHLDSNGGLLRTEVRCARCDGHLGHVFEDGPRERGGHRYCINGDALRFSTGEPPSS